MKNLPEKTKQKLVEKAEAHGLVAEIKALARRYEEDIDHLNEQVIAGISPQKEAELKKRYEQIQKQFDIDEKAIYRRYRRMGIFQIPKIK